MPARSRPTALATSRIVGATVANQSRPYLPWLRAGERVAAHEHTDGYFAEHSTPERYLASNWALLGGAALRHPPTRLAGIDPTARLHPTAEVIPPVRIGTGAVVGPGVTIGPDAVVGDGAVVNASIARTVVWAGAVVDTPPSEPVVTGEPPA